MNWYEREYIFNPNKNKFIPFCWERQKDDHDAISSTFKHPKRTCDSRRKGLETGYYLISGLDIIPSRDPICTSTHTKCAPLFF